MAFVLDAHLLFIVKSFQPLLEPHFEVIIVLHCITTNLLHVPTKLKIQRTNKILIIHKHCPAANKNDSAESCSTTY